MIVVLFYNILLNLCTLFHAIALNKVHGKISSSYWSLFPRLFRMIPRTFDIVPRLFRVCYNAPMFKDIVRLCSSVPRLKVLKFFLLQPGFRATGDTVAMTTGLQKDEVSRQLRALTAEKILVSRKQGKKISWGVNGQHSFVPALRAFLEDATVLEDSVIAKAFRGIPGIVLVVAAGLLSKEERGSVDLLIVMKNPDDAKVRKAVRYVESLAAVPLRYAVLKASEYLERLEARDRLLRDVFEFSHRVIIGRKSSS